MEARRYSIDIWYSRDKYKFIGMELLVECPIENAKECASLLASTMSKAAEEILKMPINCDVTITKVWYGEELEI